MKISYVNSNTKQVILGNTTRKITKKSYINEQCMLSKINARTNQTKQTKKKIQNKKKIFIAHHFRIECNQNMKHIQHQLQHI